MRPIITPIHHNPTPRINQVKIDQVRTADPITQLLSEWERWAEQSQPGCGECREAALLKLKTCLHNRLETLDLSNLSLTELPEYLPNGVTTLICNNNKLTYLPKNLPETLTKLEANNNKLTHLPNDLPNALLYLSCSFNELSTLPDQLPDSITTLSLCHNKLIGILPNLPRSLQSLYINNNRLNLLPNLPNSMQVLDAQHNMLIAFTNTIPALMQYLNLRYNSNLTEPRLQSHDTNHLFLIGDKVIGRGLSYDFFAKMYQWTPDIDSDFWLGLFIHHNADLFATFLEKLHQGLNAMNSELKSKVTELITYLREAQSIKLINQIFDIAAEASESCVDRASYFFNKMYLIMIEHRYIHSNDDASLSDAITVASSLFRLKELDEVAAFHVSQRKKVEPNFNEEIEIHLAYQNKLRNELALPIFTELQFANVAGLGPELLEAAKDFVLKREKRDFIRYLVTESEIWRTKIDDWNKNLREKAIDSWNDEIMSEDFETLIDLSLESEGLPIDDMDARREIGKTLANDFRYEQEYYVTKAFLKEKGLLSLLDSYDNRPG